MLARFDHRPMLTAVLALSTTVLVAVVITLSMLLITAPPQAPSPPSVGLGGNPAAPADAVGQDFSKVYQSSNEHKAAMVAAQSGHFTQGSPAEKKAEVVAAKSGHFAP